MTAYYNEINKYAAQHLRNLIAAGHIAPGVVDERSIEDVKPDELLGYAQCHFFAGVGVWSYALRQAGWPDDRPVWTGSCPCQPFSSAGKGAGFDDERHLWPSFQWLIQQCKPTAVLGEQVASKNTDPWIDLVHADLEAMGYAFGCVPFPSASVGAPHIRDRAYWVAYSSGQGLEKRIGNISIQSEKRCALKGETIELYSDVCGVGNTKGERCGEAWTIGAGHSQRTTDAGTADNWRCETNGFWGSADWLHCRDGKWRPVEPGTFPLANGVANRVGRLRSYGNAINAEQAKIFIECAMEKLLLAI